MESCLPKTDARFRPDLRAYEEVFFFNIGNKNNVKHIE
jgi:hypothetical protein